MNHAYRIVRNSVTGVWAVASELAKGHSKGTRGLKVAGASLLILTTTGLLQEAQAGGLDGGTVVKSTQVAIGTGASVTANINDGGTGVAIGVNALSSGTYGAAIGGGATAAGNQSTAIGTSSTVAAGTTNGTALGFGSSATGYWGATALGASAQASGSYSLSVGYGSVASGSYAVAVGATASASAANSVALGSGSTTTANLSAAGYNPGTATLSGTASVANGEVSMGSAGKERRVTNVAAGSSATDAVNVSQLMSEDAKVQKNTSDITDLNTQITNINGQMADAVKYDSSAHDLVTLGGEKGTKITNLTAGDVSATSTDAVNGSQLYATNQIVAQNTSDISDLQTTINNINNGTEGLVRQDQATGDITVASATGGNTVNFTGTAGARVLNGVAAGAVNATSLNAVNGSQLYGVSSSVANSFGGGSTVNSDGTISAPSYSVGGTTVNNVGDAVTNLDGRVTQNTSDIAQNTANIANLADSINNGQVGLVKQDSTTQNITVASSTGGTVVDMTGTDGARTITGVAAGAVNATSQDAINGSQLYNVSNSVANGLGGGSTVNSDGTISAPTYVVGGTTVHNAGDAITNIDDRVTQNTSNITNLTNSINSGEVGLVKQDATTQNITVASSTGGTMVDMTGTQGARTVTGVAAGAVNATSLDAVNGGQLYGVSNSVANAIGGGSTVNADGSITTPTFNVGGATVNNIGDAVTNIDGRVTQNSSDISSINSTLSNITTGSAGIKYFHSNSSQADSQATGADAVAIGGNAKATASNSVALGANSVADRANSVSVGSEGNERQITNVAAGTQGTDAVNVNQLNAATSQANANNNQRFNAMQNSVNEVAKNSYAGIAAAMAMPNLTPSAPGKTVVAAGAGAYKSGSAAGVGVTYRSQSGKWLTNGAVSVSNSGDAGARVQVGYEF